MEKSVGNSLIAYKLRRFFADRRPFVVGRLALGAELSVAHAHAVGEPYTQYLHELQTNAGVYPNSTAEAAKFVTNSIAF